MDQLPYSIFITYHHIVAINFGRQGHSLTQSKMLHCKTVENAPL
jgi:hypothetical protein